MAKAALLLQMAPAPASEGEALPGGLQVAAQSCGEMAGVCFNLQILWLQLLAEGPATWKAWQEELWDEWRVRFFGGAPIDG